MSNYFSIEFNSGEIFEADAKLSDTQRQLEINKLPFIKSWSLIEFTIEHMILRLDFANRIRVSATGQLDTVDFRVHNSSIFRTIKHKPITIVNNLLQVPVAR